MAISASTLFPRRWYFNKQLLWTELPINMSLVLLNLQSNQLIKLDNRNPLIIGRGNVDGCFDKRVSRNHGRITCTLDGKIRLVALHCNPCFITRNGVPPILQLNKDEEETLSEGDCLGLLPNAFWFQVKLSSEIKVKEEPKEADSENVVIKTDPLTKGGPMNETVLLENVECMPNGSKQTSNSFPIPNVKVESDSNSAGTSKTFGNPEFEKTRRLPLWMYEIDESVDSEKSPNKHRLKSNQGRQNKRPKIVSEVKKEPKIKSEVGTELEDEAAGTNMASASVLKDTDGQNSSSLPQAEPDAAGQVQGESSNGTHKEGYEPTVNNQPETPPKRSICQYEGNCYRKNPQHRLEFCHPGDEDFVPYEERPVCPYGAACYRRSERHRVECRHPPPGPSPRTSPPTSCQPSVAPSPLPGKRKRGVVKKQNFDCDDEYDLEDPFVNDASSDEYVPSEWDSEEEELEHLDASPGRE